MDVTTHMYKTWFMDTACSTICDSKTPEDLGARQWEPANDHIGKLCCFRKWYSYMG